MSTQHQPSNSSRTDLPRKTAVIYVRTASGAPQDWDDIYPQRDACRRHCEQLGFKIAHEFIDCGVSGVTLDRPGLRAMQHYLANHPVDYVVARDRLRISRRVQQQDTVIEALRCHGVRLETIADDDPALAGTVDIQALMQAWNLPVFGNGQNQSLQRLGPRRVARRRLHELHRVVEHAAQCSVQIFHLFLRQATGPVKRLKAFAHQHRQQHDVLVTGGESSEIRRLHSRSIISRPSVSTKHSESRRSRRGTTDETHLGESS